MFVSLRRSHAAGWIVEFTSSTDMPFETASNFAIVIPLRAAVVGGSVGGGASVVGGSVVVGGAVVVGASAGAATAAPEDATSGSVAGGASADTFFVPSVDVDEGAAAAEMPPTTTNPTITQNHHLA